jgi:hypothetical protein
MSKEVKTSQQNSSDKRCAAQAASEMVCQMIWRGSSDSQQASFHTTVELFAAKDTDKSCGVFHEEISGIDMSPLPSKWPPGFDGVRLPCKHEFHVSALALHFLTLNMTCPICRSGSDNTLMDISSLPLVVQDAFSEHADALNKRSESDNTDNSSFGLVRTSHINLTALAQQFMLYLQFQCNGGDVSIGNLPGGGFSADETHRRSFHYMTLSSRMLGLEQSSETGPFSNDTSASLQHNFLRRLQSIQFKPGSNVHVRCFITHPCIPQGIHIPCCLSAFQNCETTENEMAELHVVNPDSGLSNTVLGRINFDLRKDNSPGCRNKLCIHNFSVHLDVDMLITLCLAHVQEVLETISHNIHIPGVD